MGFRKIKEMTSSMLNKGGASNLNYPTDISLYKGSLDRSADWMVKLLILASITIVIAATITNLREAEEVRVNLLQTTGGRLLLWLGRIFLGINCLALIWRIVLFYKYRPAPVCSDELLPRCTVIVPAYNEGPQVFLGLKSLIESDFPQEKLQIIAVDDGSVDDTWYWIGEAEKQFQGRLTTLRFLLNQGKRHALYAGFRRSSGEILITVDSDSIVTPQTLRSLVSPFIYDKKIGAVAGNVRILNRSKGIIPRMLEVVFLFSFDFIRASQSMVNTVMCTPGALSAYRRETVMKILPEWVNQTFCGRPANIGEDRALTNLILREGCHVHFQQDAFVYTEVPTQYQNLCKMFLRWARSNIRETLVMSSFAFRKFREGPMLGARINLLLSWLRLTNFQLLLLGTALCFFMEPVISAVQILAGVVIASSVPAGLYCWRQRSSEGLWAYAYGIFWLVALSWITPYALLTPHKSGWLTRHKTEKTGDFVA